MTDPQFPPAPPKLPASHKWVAICCFLAAGVNIYLNVLGYWDVLGVLVTITSLAAFIGILFFRRSPRTYTIGLIGMLFFLLRAGQSLTLGVWGQFHGQGAGWLVLGVHCWLDLLLILLFRAYVFGAASRQYYGFPSVPVRRVRVEPFDAPGAEPSQE